MTTAMLRKSGIPAVGDIPWGTHFCHFYQTQQDLRDVVIPYLHAGLENHEACLWVVAERPDRRTWHALRRAIPDIDRRLAAGDLEILLCSRWYLDGKTFDPQRVIDGWNAKLEEALAKGYAGLRVAADEAWLGRRYWRAFAEYEKEIDQIIAKQDMIVLCAYPLAASGGSAVFDVAHTHQFAVAERDGSWEILETSALKRAKAELAARNEDLERRVAEHTKELEASNAALRREIAERKRAEAAAKESEELYRLLVENSNDLITLLDLQGRHVYVSPSFRRLLGRDPTPDIDFGNVHPEDRAGAHDTWEALIAGKPRFNTYRYRDASGGWRWLEMWAALVRYRGQPHVFTVNRDVTERKRLEEQVRQSQKLEAVGRLAGGVAHDFNNLLTVIMSYVDLLLDDLEPGDVRREDGEQIRKAAEAAASLTRQLLAFSRQQMLEPRLLDLRAIVTDAEKLLRRLIGEDIELVTVLGEDVGVIEADAGQLEQVVMNLAVNARDAMPEGGRLTIEVAGTDLDEAEVRGRHPPARPGRYVRLAVHDTGVGMDEETRAHIFEPFFTTKEVGRGTGLGLATVYGIVTQLSGFIQVDSEPGRGTTCTIYLPRADAEAAPQEAASAGAAGERGTETVLLVEDTPAVRAVAREVLERAGYTVLEAPDGPAALALSAKHPGPIHVLLTDVVMPTMSGKHVADLLTELRPGLKVLYMSGYTDDAIGRHGVLEPGVAYLPKPFRPEALVRKLREVLDAR